MDAAYVYVHAPGAPSDQHTAAGMVRTAAALVQEVVKWYLDQGGAPLNIDVHPTLVHVENTETGAWVAACGWFVPASFAKALHARLVAVTAHVRSLAL